MTEQDKRAEEVWREAWAAWEAVWDQENEDVSSDEAACAVISATLAQARRKGFIVAAKYYDDRGVTDEEINLDADELLAKEEAGEIHEQ